MALKEELTATQLLQGLQKESPRLFDLFNIVIRNLKDVDVRTGDAPRELRKQTVTTARGVSLSSTLYQTVKRVSLRL